LASEITGSSPVVPPFFPGAITAAFGGYLPQQTIRARGAARYPLIQALRHHWQTVPTRDNAATETSAEEPTLTSPGRAPSQRSHPPRMPVLPLSRTIQFRQTKP